MESRMWPALLLSHLLPLWPLLLLPLPPPAQGSSSSPRTPPAPARPPCARGGPSAPRHVCVWERAPPPSRSPRVPRSRRQVLPGTAPPATPSGFEEGPPSSQYPWAIVWGPTVSREDGGDPNSANPGFLDYGFAAPHGLATPHPNSDSMRGDGDGLILGEAPATLRPFLFGGRGEGVDPQLYVTITISIIIVLVATGIIFKFCWDRSQKRRRPSGQQGALRQEESQQPLTDLSPAGVTVLGAFGDSPTPTPDHEEPRGGPRPGMPHPKGAPAFQLNREGQGDQKKGDRRKGKLHGRIGGGSRRKRELGKEAELGQGLMVNSKQRCQANKLLRSQLTGGMKISQQVADGRERAG
ncbi:PILR alpha-associated neural protein isoform X2 [Pongo abelii]|uniref:PIANP isoform 1 n=2 Tax=Pongo abelii TaxID=9601 RepID=A0A2J8TBB0_PONAB|nr:PILR alpha-associated neural protein isoform X2 [Pongo abelii]PNJ30310.1 PIANP isoform 1 [Pongo abelii]